MGTRGSTSNITPADYSNLPPKVPWFLEQQNTRVSSFGTAKWSPPQLVLTAEVRLKSRQSEFTKMGDRWELPQEADLEDTQNSWVGRKLPSGRFEVVMQMLYSRICNSAEGIRYLSLFLTSADWTYFVYILFLFYSGVFLNLQTGFYGPK